MLTMKLPSKIDLSDLLIEYKKEHRLSQTELAKKSGVSQRTISSLLNPESVDSFSLKTVQKLVKNLRLDLSNIGDRLEVTQELPLISWVQAGSPEDVQDLFHAGEYEDLVPVTKLYSRHSYALRVQGDSMQASSGISFPDGCIICVDPEITYENGSYVVAKFPDTQQATFKQLVIEAGETYLKPLNDRYPIKEIDKKVVICGVVRQLLMDL